MDEGLKNLVTKAEQGDVDAMVMVGDCYNRGLHTEKDDQEAHRYYKMAADKGHVQANLMVLLMLRFEKNRRKVDKSYCREWYYLCIR